MPARGEEGLSKDSSFEPRPAINVSPLDGRRGQGTLGVSRESRVFSLKCDPASTLPFPRLRSVLQSPNCCIFLFTPLLNFPVSTNQRQQVHCSMPLT